MSNLVNRSYALDMLQQSDERPKLFVSPLGQVRELIASTNTRYIISLMDPHWDIATPENIKPENHLKLFFNDIAGKKSGMTPPDKKHIIKLIDFVMAWDMRDPMIMHCLAGVSRSTAAAFIAQCALNTNYDEKLIAKRMRELSDIAAPNTLMVSHADKILRRRGRMVRALKRMGRAEKTVVGDIISLPAVITS